MSVRSYRRNVERKVTGAGLPTCFPAALEQISPNHALHPEVYKDYQEFIKSYDSMNKRQRNPAYKDMINWIVEDLGDLTCNDLIFTRAHTYGEFSRIIRKLIRQTFRVSVDIVSPGTTDGSFHTVGLIPTELNNEFKLVSNQIPAPLRGIVTLSEVYPYIAQPKEEFRPRYPFNDSNITALPPAA